MANSTTGMAFPKELMKWLSTLPAADAARETMVAERNLRRIANHYAIYKKAV